LAGDVSIAGVIVAISIAVGPVAGIACRTGDTVAYRTSLTSACLATLTALTTLSGLTALPGLAALGGLAALPPLTAFLSALSGFAVLGLLLAGLAGLPLLLAGLPVAAELVTLVLLAALLARLALLAATARLTLPGLSVGTSAEAGELVAQTR